MALPATPSRFYVQQGNGTVYLNWGICTGATLYKVQRSTDGVNFSDYASMNNPGYTDTAVTVGTQYWYQVYSINGNGSSPFTAPQSVVPTLSGQQSLGEIRLMAQQRADRVNSNFVTLPEWNSFIRLAQYELYDLLIDQNQMRYVAPAVQFTTNGNTYLYPLPNGVLSFTGDTGASFVARPFYKLLGVDMGVQNANNAWVTVNQFNFIERNKFLYPNTASSIYGVFNCQYRLSDNNIQLIPTPSGNQIFRLWYIPALEVPLSDSDLVEGVSGWTQYIICRAAKYALDKEESDTSGLDQELSFLIKRIESASKDRDVGQADTISDTRGAHGGFDGGWGGGRGGF